MEYRGRRVDDFEEGLVHVESLHQQHMIRLCSNDVVEGAAYHREGSPSFSRRRCRGCCDMRAGMQLGPSQEGRRPETPCGVRGVH